MEETKTYRGFVYYIAADSDPEKRIYIGSSILTPSRRRALHKHTNGRHWTTADAIILQFSDWDLYVIEWYDLAGTKEQSILELRQHEQQWIEIMRDDCVNKKNASGHDEEKDKITRRAANRKYLQTEKGKAGSRRKSRDYYAKNKEACLAKDKEYRRANRERLKARQREYRRANRERLNAQQQEYRRANRELLNTKQREYTKKKNKAAMKD